MVNIKNFFSFLSAGERETVNIEKNMALYGSMFFVLVSSILTLMNINKSYWFMAGTTGVLIFGFLIAMILALKDYLKASQTVMSIMCGIIFSVYAITGQNEGFAILWILLVPVLGMHLVGLSIGFMLSAYFQLFLLVLFYTPLKGVIQGNPYTLTFMHRFPVLYFASFGASTLMMCERQRLYHSVHSQAYNDGLTSLHNRAYYRDYSVKAESFPYLTIVAMDLNGLKYVNDTLGHDSGDKLICDAASAIDAAFPSDARFRIGGDEFTVISNDPCIKAKIEPFKLCCPNISVGCASRTDHPGLTFAELSKEADRLMYIEKALYHKQNGRNMESRHIN